MLHTLKIKLEPERKIQAIANCMYEAASDWRDLGERLLEAEGYDLSTRVKQEFDLFKELQEFYGGKLDESPRYANIMELGTLIIEAGKQYKPPPDGYLGSIKIVRETFAFLQADFGLVPGQEPDFMWDYTSDRVCVYLRLPRSYSSSCQLNRLSNPSKDFELEDLLFMDGISASLALPPGQKIATRDDVQAWFTTVADVLRQHGSDVLADRPGAFERLAKAADERARLYIEECERLYGSGKTDVLAAETADGTAIILQR